MVGMYVLCVHRYVGTISVYKHTCIVYTHTWVYRDGITELDCSVGRGRANRLL